MADAEQTQQVASWIQTGGVLAFAGAVLWELRLLRPIIAEVKVVLAQLLERERMRSEQRALLIQQQERPRRHESDFGFEDVTDTVSTPPRRAQTPGRGHPIGGYRPPAKPPRSDDE